MKKFTVLLIIFLVIFNQLNAQLANFNFNVTPYVAATSTNANLIVNNIQLSTGILATNVQTGAYFTDEPYIEASGGWTATTELTAKYFYVDITAQAGYRFSITNVAFDMYATSAGPSGASIIIDNTPVYTTNVPSAALLSINAPFAGGTKYTHVTLKIAGWLNGSRTTTGTGIFKIDNLGINGLVELIPPNDSNSSLKTTSFTIPNEITLHTADAFIPIMEVALTDSASTDGLATLIDSLIIKPGAYNQFSNFTEIISQAKWVCNHYHDTVLGVVGNTNISFHTPGFEITEGILNTDSCRLLIKFKTNLPDADAKTLGFLLDSAHVYCKPTGSKMSWGKAETGSNRLRVNIVGTLLRVNVEPEVLWKDSLFKITVLAVDTYNNLDKDENGQVQLALDKGEGELLSTSTLSRNFTQGKTVFNELRFTGSDTISLKIQSDDFEDFLVSDLLVGKPLFYDDFESGNLSKWSNINDWTVSTINPINNAHSLKHNLSGVSGYSYLVSEHNSLEMNRGKMVWRMVMKNGNFDPTSTNRFWYYLMAADSNLLTNTNYGYAVGVNYLGSNDTLSVWKVDSTGNKTLLLASSFEWSENETIAVEVIREVSGYWKLGYAENTLFNGLIYTQKVIDNSYINLPFHGLVYQYSSTRAGLLSCDDISVRLLNTPPQLAMVKEIACDTLLLSFTEPVNKIQAENKSNYAVTSKIDAGVNLKGVLFDLNYPDKVKLIVNQLKTAQYTIHVNNLVDLDGSIMLVDSISFIYAVPAKRADVVFNEIMYDPTPVVGLPEADYIEIYNRSENPFNLNGWKLNIDGLVKTFPDTIIEAGEYLTLSSSTFATIFTGFGKFIGLLSTTSLTNTGKPLQLFSANGLLIDSLFYNPGWISDEQKLDGGWSLERIDPDNLCSQSLNWNASVDAKGGTPGTQNSLFESNLDTVPPHLTEWNQLSMRHFEFYFNEELDAKSLNKNLFLLFSSFDDIVDSLKFSSNAKTVSVYLSDSIKPDQNYQFTLSHFSDLCGNAFSDTMLQFLHHPIAESDMVFNEIMADAEPSNGLPETDYLEIFNRSNFPLKLKNIELWLGTTRKVFPEIELLPDSFLIVCQTGHSAAFSGFGNTVELLSSTSLTNTDKAIVLKDTAGILIDSVFYQSSWYHNPDKADGGWSLERIDPENFCGTMSNWSASVNETGGTPGKLNSVYKPNIDVQSPKLITSQFSGLSGVQLVFSEPLRTKISDFIIEGMVIDSAIQSNNDNSIIYLYVKSTFVSKQKYTLKIKNVSDYCGNTIKDSLVEMLFYIPSLNDIVFNEIMADPTPIVGLPESDYFELYNRSEYAINLENWELWLGSTRKVFSEIRMLPHSFIIVCQTGQSAAFSGFGNALELLSSTSLTTTDKALVLKDTSGLIIDSVFYQSSWYHNPDKVDGGWSMERIDPENFCGTMSNWSASVNETGGTPGKQNSVYKPNIDVQSPKLITSQFSGLSGVQLVFSEPLRTKISDFAIEGMVIDSAIQSNNDNSIIHLYIKSTFLSKQKYTLKIKSISDYCGNEIKDTTIEMLFYIPGPNDIVFNEIMADPTPPVGLPEVSYIELLNRSKHPINLRNWKLKYSTYFRIFPDFVLDSGAYVLLCPTGQGALLSKYGNVLDVLSSATLTISGRLLELADSSGQIISSVNYHAGWYQNPDKANGGWSLERINPNIFTGDSSNWQASFDKRGGTPGFANSLPLQTIDSILPVLLHWKMISNTLFEFEFSETMGGFTIDANLILSFSPSDVTIKSAQWSNDFKQLSITLSNSIKKHQKYEITLNGLADLSDNIMNDTVLQFIYNPVGANDIVFNEIMADASPTVGLPESDYFELFNRGNFPLNLENIELWIGTTRKVFPKIELLPNSFLIVCQTGQSAAFSGFGNVVELLSSSSLTTTDKALVLKDTSGSVIDSVYYQSSWYQNPDKVDGGWSLERIDPNNFCGTVANWQASESEKGGTPGRLNSIYKPNQDTVKPHVRYHKIETDTSIRLEFSELLAVKSIKEISNFLFENNTILIDSLSVINGKTSVVLLFLNQPFTVDGRYALKIKNMVDLCGNIMNDTVFQFEFTLAKPNDVVFSEIMIDPSPVIGLPEYEYVELFNRSTQKYELENWQWVVNGSVKKLPRLTLLPKSFITLVSNSALIEFGFVTNKTGIPSFPSLPNTAGTMQLLDGSGQIVNEIQYDISWYNNENKSDGGWSMEIIDPNNQCSGASNWRASSNQRGGTPGEINSVNATNIDINSPTLVEVIVASNSTLLLKFSEFLNEPSLVQATIIANELGAPAQISINTEDASLVSLNFSTSFEANKNYQLSLSGISDNCDNEMSDTLINFTYYNAQLYNMVINEIMANPEPSLGLPELEYIELYNNTQYEIQAYNWIIKVGGSVRTMPYMVLAAQSYLVLYNGDFANPFPTSIKAIGIYDLPALPLSGNISLMNATGELICQTAYELAWFTDDFKADGGFSLERIDYNNPDETHQNWQASDSDEGGTPGKINSVYRSNADVTPPDLVRAFPINDRIIGLQFSELMNSATVTLNEIIINNQLNLIDSLFTQNNNLSIFYLALSSNLLPGLTYNIHVSEALTDIAGNSILNRDAKLGLPIKASPTDLVINELLWNPFDGGVDFVEFYNRSAFTLNLKEFLIATYDEDGNIKTPKRITTDGALLFPSEYMVLSENHEIVKQHYWIENPFAFVDMVSLPSFSNTEGSVVIIDTNGVVIDNLFYTDDMHFDLLKDTKGVSLERVQANRSSQEKSNWHSASQKAGWATPGYKNSMAIGEIEGDGTITMERDAFSPDGDGNNDVLYINYKLDEPGYVANITLFDAKGRKTKTLTNNELLGTEGILAWDGLTDSHQKAAIGIYIIYIELFNLQGDVKKYKKVCALNGRLD